MNTVPATPREKSSTETLRADAARWVAERILPEVNATLALGGLAPVTEVNHETMTRAMRAWCDRGLSNLGLWSLQAGLVPAAQIASLRTRDEVCVYGGRTASMWKKDFFWAVRECRKLNAGMIRRAVSA